MNKNVTKAEMQFTTAQQIIDFLKNSHNNKEFVERIYKSPTEVLGSQIGLLRDIAKYCSSEVILGLPYNLYVETDIIKGLSIVKSKESFAQKRHTLIDFAHHIDNWATCDVCIVKLNKAEKQEYFDFFVDLLIDKHPFAVRYGIVNLMSSYLDSCYVDAVIEKIAIIKQGHYYIDMALAWLIATMSAKFLNKAKEIISGNLLTPTVKKMALQKIRDSVRTDINLRQWTYSVK